MLGDDDSQYIPDVTSGSLSDGYNLESEISDWYYAVVPDLPPGGCVVNIMKRFSLCFFMVLCVLPSCKKSDIVISNVANELENVSSAVEAYTSSKRMIWQSRSTSGRSEPPTLLFRLSKNDPLPPNEYQEVLDRSYVKGTVLSQVKTLDEFKDVRLNQLADSKRWFEFENGRQLRAIYFLTDSGERYFLVTTYGK